MIGFEDSSMAASSMTISFNLTLDDDKILDAGLSWRDDIQNGYLLNETYFLSEGNPDPIENIDVVRFAYSKIDPSLYPRIGVRRIITTQIVELISQI